MKRLKDYIHKIVPLSPVEESLRITLEDKPSDTPVEILNKYPHNKEMNVGALDGWAFFIDGAKYEDYQEIAQYFRDCGESIKKSKFKKACTEEYKAVCLIEDNNLISMYFTTKLDTIVQLIINWSEFRSGITGYGGPIKYINLTEFNSRSAKYEYYIIPNNVFAELCEYFVENNILTNSPEVPDGIY